MIVYGFNFNKQSCIKLALNLHPIDKHSQFSKELQQVASWAFLRSLSPNLLKTSTDSILSSMNTMFESSSSLQSRFVPFMNLKFNLEVKFLALSISQNSNYGKAIFKWKSLCASGRFL